LRETIAMIATAIGRANENPRVRVAARRSVAQCAGLPFDAEAREVGGLVR
jgi:hypothetical protein